MPLQSILVRPYRRIPPAPGPGWALLKLGRRDRPRPYEATYATVHTAAVPPLWGGWAPAASLDTLAETITVLTQDPDLVGVTVACRRARARSPSVALWLASLQPQADLDQTFALTLPHLPLNAGLRRRLGGESRPENHPSSPP